MAEPAPRQPRRIRHTKLKRRPQTEELMARVWPGTVVEEGNLKVHIAALRPTLADGQAGRRYLATIPGRDCRIVVPAVLTEEPPLREPLRAAAGHVERRSPEESFPAWLSGPFGAPG